MAVDFLLVLCRLEVVIVGAQFGPSSRRVEHIGSVPTESKTVISGQPTITLSWPCRIYSFFFSPLMAVIVFAGNFGVIADREAERNTKERQEGDRRHFTRMARGSTSRQPKGVRTWLAYGGRFSAPSYIVRLKTQCRCISLTTGPDGGGCTVHPGTRIGRSYDQVPSSIVAVCRCNATQGP